MEVERQVIAEEIESGGSREGELIIEDLKAHKQGSGGDDNES